MIPKTVIPLPAFRVLQAEDRDWLEQTGTEQQLAPGDVLIQEGSPADCIYILLSGKVIVSISQSDSPEDQKIAECSAGEMLGEMSLIDDRPPSATVKAIEPSHVLVIPKRSLQTKLALDADFAARFYQEIAITLSVRLRSLSKLLAESHIIPGQALRKVLFVFAILNDNDIDWMTSQGRREQVAAGTILIQQGQPVEAVYIVLKGNLAVTFTTQVNGKSVEKEIARRASGEIVGEMSFVETGVASASIRCAENSLLLALPQDLLWEKLSRDRGFATRFYQAISIALVDRLREGLVQRGFGQRAYNQDEMLSSDVEYEDEIALDVLEQTLLAGTRFKWMINRLQGS
ncbi:MAG: cyclic nucleotide-binding domain-containing protein [Leptolyngbyaceae cyanobacterium bins.349]|nr:cyclic nucleotide-binding domain-containing protein [Leptolyngbyaceae cyanobacterium bins.349]